ncbi:GNAT family N-acetyltransferase [uncultured Thioclava sp.]|jgi:ribosomal protein S18 acetylase RimI-like enzyme|uniref:GNAT family N-acetyltransferase n=1 Tax=uncultured Thioclava sp. TaxID=473858 RepID=UPI0025F11405|nr:GNAT family N-acetyltransferase [uncultured Thioclava sp.]
MNAITYHHGLRPDQRARAAGLYWQAFGGKLGRVMGPQPRALDFIERVIAPQFAIAACDPHGQVIGVIGFRTPHGSFVGGGLPDLRASYGRIGGLWRAGCLRFLAQDLEAGTVMVDGIAVSADLRGHGIGTELIETLSSYAQSQGYRALCLEVVEENLRARALYHRLGFMVTGQRHSAFTRFAFNFHRVHEMRRAL